MRHSVGFAAGLRKFVYVRWRQFAADTAKRKFTEVSDGTSSDSTQLILTKRQPSRVGHDLSFGRRQLRIVNGASEYRKPFVSIKSIQRIL